MFSEHRLDSLFYCKTKAAQMVLPFAQLFYTFRVIYQNGLLCDASMHYIIPGIPPPMPPPIGIAGSSDGASVIPASVVSSIAEADAAF